MPIDFTFHNHGSIWLVRPQNDDAREHLEDNVAPEAQWFGGALAVASRYAAPLVAALTEEGWVVA